MRRRGMRRNAKGRFVRLSKYNPGRRSYRRNPWTLDDYVAGMTSPIKVLPAALKGPNMVKNLLYIGGGAAGTFVVGGLAAATVVGALEGQAWFRENKTLRTAIGAALPYTLGWAGSQVMKDNKDIAQGLLVGGAVASALELLSGLMGFPNPLAQLIGAIKGAVSPAVPKNGTEATVKQAATAAAQGASGVFGDLGRQVTLAGYVDAPAYAGTAGYVDAPAYAGTAGMGQTVLAGYVDAPAYAGTNGLGRDMLAGNYMEDASMFQPPF